MGTTPLYVRVRGQVLGPFDRGQLEALRDRGQLQRFHEVSEDRQKWRPAADVPGLFAAAAPAHPSPRHEEPPPPRRQPRYEDEWDDREEVYARVDDDAERRVAVEPAPATNRGLLIALLLGCAGMFLFLVAGGLIWWKVSQGRVGGKVSNLLGGPISGLGNEKDIAEAVGLVVCGLEVIAPDGKRTERPFSTGTCFAVNSDGYLLTNKHVIEEVHNAQRAPLLRKMEQELTCELRPKVWVFFTIDRTVRKFDAEIVHVSDRFDMGILRVRRESTPFLALSETDQLPRGRPVKALGFPGSAQAALSKEEELRERVRKAAPDQPLVEDQFKPRDFEFVLTGGSISRVTTEEKDRRWVQHDASLNPGNSGGPLVNEDGVVLGVNTIGIRGASGTFYSLAMPQLKEEIAAHVPSGVVWR
jgi:S1-C subfamily serine protease